MLRVNQRGIFRVLSERIGMRWNESGAGWKTTMLPTLMIYVDGTNRISSSHGSIVRSTVSSDGLEFSKEDVIRSNAGSVTSNFYVDGRASSHYFCGMESIQLQRSSEGLN